MATQNKTYLDLAGLQKYDGLIKAWVDGTGNASHSNVIFRTVLYDSDNIYFYHKAGATSSDTADVTVPLKGSDVTKALAEISAIVTGLGGTMSSTAPYTVTFPSLTTTNKASIVAAINEVDANADAAQADVDALETLVGTLPAGATATTVVGYIDEAVEGAVAGLDATEFALASVANNVVTIKGIKEENGVIEVGTDSTKNIVLEEVAYTGAAADVSYSNTTSGLNATDVQSAIDEIKGGLGTAAAADKATTAIVESSTDNNLVSAAQVSAFVAQEIAGLEGAMHFRGVVTRQEGETDAQAIARAISNPKAGDVVVMSDNAKEYIYESATIGWKEVGDETEFVKKTTTIAGVDLQDSITKTELLTALNVADGAQVNTIESVQVNGSALTPDGNKAVNVTVAEGATDGTIAVNGSDVAVHGLGSAAYTASTAYDAAGTAAAAIEALDTLSDVGIASYAAGTSGAADVITLTGSIKEEDGIVKTGTADAITLSTVTNSEIDALFAVSNS